LNGRNGVRARRDWRREHGVVNMDPQGAWLDVDEGVCTRCEETRRLYCPVAQQALRVCADCSQVCVLSSLHNREDPTADLDDNPVKEYLRHPDRSL
jgi:hypothetical protein